MTLKEQQTIGKSIHDRIKSIMNNSDRPAYPTELTHPDRKGLTKLEIFTKAAMQGLCSGLDKCSSERAINISIIAIKIATETLKQLEAKP